MGSVAVGDVPARTLAAQFLIILGGEHGVAEVPVTQLLATLLFSDHRLLISTQDLGEVWCGVFHKASVGHSEGFGKRCGRFAEWFGGIAKGAGVLYNGRRRVTVRA